MCLQWVQGRRLRFVTAAQEINHVLMTVSMLGDGRKKKMIEGDPGSVNGHGSVRGNCVHVFSLESCKKKKKKV